MARFTVLLLLCLESANAGYSRMYDNEIGSDRLSKDDVILTHLQKLYDTGQLLGPHLQNHHLDISSNTPSKVSYVLPVDMEKSELKKINDSGVNKAASSVKNLLKFVRSARSISGYRNRYNSQRNRWLKRYNYWNGYRPYRKTFDPLASNLIG